MLDPGVEGNTLRPCFPKGWSILIAACLGLLLAACSEVTAPVATNATTGRDGVSASVKSSDVRGDVRDTIEPGLERSDPSFGQLQTRRVNVVVYEVDGKLVVVVHRRSNYAVAF